MDENAKEVSRVEPAGAQGGRPSAKVVLKCMIERKGKELNSLYVLMDHINWDALSRKDEELLWGYFVRRD